MLGTTNGFSQTVGSAQRPISSAIMTTLLSFSLDNNTTRGVLHISRSIARASLAETADVEHVNPRVDEEVAHMRV